MRSVPVQPWPDGRGQAYRTPALLVTVEAGLHELKEVAQAIRTYPEKPAAGQWNWVEDAEQALEYHRWITEEGWPRETRGFQNPYGGRTFPVE